MSRPKQQTDEDGRLTEAFRQERLEHLRKRIDERAYRVSTRHVAAAILRRGLPEITGRSERQG
jgi:anti-sigma28 factor (negative regulator of flagellin synthesis)